MESSVEESNSESSLQDEFIWECQTNVDPWDATQTAAWTPYSNTISSAIEEAYKRRCEEIVINQNYRIDLKHNMQHHINNPNRQRPVRRRRRWGLPSTISTDRETEDELSRAERYSFPLGEVMSCSAIGDTTYYGSSFVHDWLVMFTKGKMKVTFDTIFPVLVEGLIKEAPTDTQNKVIEIKVALNKVENETHKQSSEKRIKHLQECCANLYTKACHIHRIVNTALRNNDRTKLYSLGPFSYLLFNYIGQRFKENSSIRDRIRQVLRPNEIQSITLYRGDRNSGGTVEEYRRALGDKSRYFKWFPFVSTSRNRIIAEKFAVDVLYIIEMRSYSSNEDRFTELTGISDYSSENEIILLPGVQFTVNKLEFDNDKGLYLVYIKINSSYISKLK